MITTSLGSLFGLALCLGGSWRTLEPAHPGSISRSRIVVDGGAVRHVLRVQALSLIEVLPIDLDDDLRLDPAELAAARPTIQRYVLDNYELLPNGSTESLPLEVAEFRPFNEGSAELPSGAWIEIGMAGEHSILVESLGVRERLFEVSAPGHVEYLSVRWLGQVPTHHVFYRGDTIREFQPSGEAEIGVLRSFFELGVRHILTGYDHLLFLLALLVAVRGVRSLALVVTAFTLAHSVTLAVAALDLVSLPSRFVELAIALSIVYVAAENLMRIEKRALWMEALVFGLLHGLGFAGFLSDALAYEDSILLPLVGFNLGVEAGQALALLPLAALFYLHYRRRLREAPDGEPVPLVPVGLGRVASGLIVLLGMFWFLERAGFLPS